MSEVLVQRKKFDSKWPVVLEREVARINRWPAVVEGSVAILCDEENLYIDLTVKTNDLVENIDAPILGEEPLTFVFPIGEIGVTAPLVWSRRDDFPRNVGHVNSTKKDQPASLCIARSGAQHLYDHNGIDGVVYQTILWLNDAKTGDLMRDGWEPVPLQAEQEVRMACFDEQVFQRIAANSPEGSYACGITKIRKFGESGERRYYTLHEQIDLTKEGASTIQNIRFSSPPNEVGVASYIPWIYVWSDQNKPITDQFFYAWNTFEEIMNSTGDVSLGDHIAKSIMSVYTRLGDKIDLERNRLGGRAYVLVLGCWRPKQIINDIFGLAEDEMARCVEVKAYLIQRDGETKPPIDGAQKVSQLHSVSFSSREMLQYMSGIKEVPSVALIGCGALGAAVADNLLRSGVSQLSVMDNDTLFPHNVARHIGVLEDTFGAKVESIKRLAGRLYGGAAEISNLEKDFLNLSEEELVGFLGSSDCVVDATADERVRKSLCCLTACNEKKVYRTEIYDRGKLGVLFASGKANNPNFMDLYYSLCQKAIENKQVERWLRNQARFGAANEELLLGMGCSSATTRMPKYVISQHASAFMPKIFNSADDWDAGVGVNPLDDNNFPLGWIWYGIPPFKIFQVDDWQVRISQDVIKKLNDSREKSGAQETGGYLLGGFDYSLKQVYVVDVSDLPPDSIQDSARLELGPSGKTDIERQLSRKTGDKIINVGTWHSHPNSGPDISHIDDQTMRGFVDKDKKNGVPTLLVITSKSGTKSYLWV